jgi:hypothetical protein
MSSILLTLRLGVWDYSEVKWKFLLLNAFHFFLGHFIGFDILLEQDGG